MAREINRLSSRKVEAEKKPGRYSDGAGLYLDVSKAGARKWVFIYRSPTQRVMRGGKTVGRIREMGLGAVTNVTLANARQKAADARAMLDAKRDPLDERKAAVEAPLLIPSFGEMADAVISALEPGWRNRKHREQWRVTLGTYCASLRDKPVDTIGTDDVLEVLINGQSAGVRLWEPYAVELTEFLRPGENVLELRVANTLANLLKGVERPSGLAGAPKLTPYRRFTFDLRAQE